MICRLAIAVAVILLTFTSSASAQSETRITGVVRDATGVGLAGATVTVTSRTTRDSKTATTGPDGSYSVAVAAGSYTVSAAFPSFRGASETVDVTAGGPKQVDFTLETTLTEEITVTASKREQTLLEVPFSVAAVTEETLRKRGVEDLRASRQTSAASRCRTSVPARARLRCAACRPARSCATSPA